ncbi:uncharacterized protein LOC108196228 isoform X1 [Daucus carota subsp. sativus]|uniref:uncharacterized protein LOC108196228 isoform X1 n=1 Tax=Daucus carota subsp. sativus TaxID=79200 RepID=UPI0007EF47A2|nr:PREDICTED: uncharacterized protein LOC108196228 isoform X1 [Daucus carota subsp. sativus]
MAAKSNSGYYLEQSMAPILNRQISFQSSAMDNTSDMIYTGNYYGANRNAEGSIVLGSSSSNAGLRAHQAASTSSPLLVDSVPGLKHEAGLAVEWSVEEQYRLEEGLAKYADEPSILRYIKIAAMLHDKTVRDVALRCRWMTRKRRKQEDHNFGKKVKDRKDKLMESSSKATTSSVSPLNVAGYSFMRNYQSGNDRMSREGLRITLLHTLRTSSIFSLLISALDGARHLLEQNNEVLRHISANLSVFKLQENIDLFSCTRNNITTILNHMSNMRGVMSRMPPLPLSINEELANSILPITFQRMMFGLPSGSQLKQEPR